MTDDTKVSRRGLLALLGLGSAAAAVASKVEASDEVDVEALQRAADAARETALALEKQAYAARAVFDEPLAQTVACKSPWMDDMQPVSLDIDPSTYPRVRVRRWVGFGEGFAEFGTSAVRPRPFAPSEFYASNRTARRIAEYYADDEDE